MLDQDCLAAHNRIDLAEFIERDRVEPVVIVLRGGRRPTNAIKQKGKMK